MELGRIVLRIVLAAGMAVAGAAHLVSPRPFIAHLPDAIPLRGELVAVTGIIEIVLAAGLIGPRPWRRPAGLALAAYLVLVFPANVYAAVSQVPIDGIPTGWIRWARLPLQLPLIAAAWWVAREPSRIRARD
ncbi:MAG: DoxX family protein [Candidatus Limnocylindria bacterium]